VTEAARNFADCVNRVRYQGACFVLQKNGLAVARIVPVEEPKAKTENELGEPRDETVPGVLKRRDRVIW
jgi:antitoxin (DNA-binding transcriptional repressor) of toxin-antitoxin stability system